MKLLSVILLVFVALSGNTEETNSSRAIQALNNLSKNITKLLEPKDMSLYVGERCTFVIETNFEKVDKVVITEGENEVKLIEVTSKKNVYCTTLRLHVGENSFTIDYYKDGDLVDTASRKIYFLSELLEGSDDDIAEDYNKNYMHTDKNEQKCKACHNMTSNVPLDGEAFEDVSKTTCYNCHKDMMNTRNTHAPAANWLCLNCHNGKFGEYNMEDEGASKYLAPDPIAKTCEYCHEKVEKWTRQKYTHGPVNDGRCVRCHNPHGSNYEFFLRKPIWNLCTTCHAEKGSGKHVVSSFVYSRNKGAHPTKGPRDPARPERTFACSSCHNPHGSAGIFLLRMKGSMPFSVCRRCHDK